MPSLSSSLSAVTVPAPLTSAAVAAAQSALNKIRIAAWCGLSVVVWELITHSPQELKMWKRKKTPATLSFLIARWSGVMVLVMGLLNVNGKGFDCQAVHFFVYFFYAVMSSAVSYVFCCRVLALYHMDRSMILGMNAAFSLLLGAWIATLAGLRAQPTGRSIAGSSCQNRDPKWFILGWAASVAFDFVVLLATICKIYQVQIRGEVLEYVRKSSIIYFLSILACNSSVLVTNFAAGSAGYARVIPIPDRANGRKAGTSGSAGLSNKDMITKRSLREAIAESLPFRNLSRSRSRHDHQLQSGILTETHIITTESPIDASNEATVPANKGLSLAKPVLE